MITNYGWSTKPQVVDSEDGMVLSTFRPGIDTLAMVAGDGIDVVDVDTKAGGDVRHLPLFRRFARHRTPAVATTTWCGLPGSSRAGAVQHAGAVHRRRRARRRLRVRTGGEGITRVGVKCRTNGTMTAGVAWNTRGRSGTGDDKRDTVTSLGHKVPNGRWAHQHWDAAFCNDRGDRSGR